MSFDSFHGSKLGVFLESALGARGLEGGDSLSGNLLASGTFFNLEGNPSFQSRLARFDGSQWNRVGTTGNSINEINGSIYAMEIFQNALYIGGNFSVVGPNGFVSASRIARFDLITNTWSALGTGLNATCYALKAHAGLLFIAGSFTQAGPLTSLGNMIAWDGSSFVSVGTPIVLPGGDSKRINAFAIHGGSLYVGGRTRINQALLARYDGGSSWSQCTYTPAPSSSAEVYSFGTYQGNLLAVGNPIFNSPGFFLGKIAGLSVSPLRVRITPAGSSSWPTSAVEFQGSLIVKMIALPDGLKKLNPSNTTPLTPDGTLEPYPVYTGVGGSSGYLAEQIALYQGNLVADSGTKKPGNVAGVATYSGSGNWVKLGAPTITFANRFLVVP
ncbi:MAG: hypothetical protein AB7F75_01225 [Planctomycetota bacterium]